MERPEAMLSIVKRSYVRFCFRITFVRLDLHFSTSSIREPQLHKKRHSFLH